MSFGRVRELISAHTRGVIVRKLRERGSWHGYRRGIEMHFVLSAQATLEGHRIEWRARRLTNPWQQGKAATVFDAIREIETQEHL